MGPTGPQVIHVSYTPATVEQVYFPQCEVVGDVGPSLELLADRIEARLPNADHLALREIDLLDRRRRVADVDHLRARGPHDERRLLDGVVANSEDEVGAVDRLVNIVALAERGG